MAENIDVKIVLKAIDQASGDIKKVRDISKDASRQIEVATRKEKLVNGELSLQMAKTRASVKELTLEKLKLREATLKSADASKAKSKSMINLRESILNVKNASILFAGYLSGQVVKSLIDTQLQVDNFSRTLKVATGSQELAGLEMQFLKDQSQRLGLEFASVGSSYAKLSASARMSGLSIAETRQVFLATSEAGASLGLSIYDMEGALNAFQQMLSKGTVQAEELRGQLGERIPGAFAMAAKSMGVTEQELGKMLEKGQVLARDLLPKMAVEMRNTFGAGAEEGAKSLNGEMNRFKNSMFDLKKAVLDSGLSVALVSMFAKGAEKISGAVKAYNEFRSSMGDGEKATQANQKALISHMITVMNTTDVYGEMNDAIKKISAIKGDQFGTHFANLPKEQQLKLIQATTREMVKQKEIESKTLSESKPKGVSSVKSLGEEDAKSKRLDAIQKQANEERELNDFIEQQNTDTEKAWQEERIKNLQESMEVENLIYENNLKVQQEWAEQEKIIQNQKKDLAWDTTTSVIGAMRSLSGQGRKYALLNKTLAIADIGVNTARSVMQALTSPPGPPWTIPLAGAMGVMGAGQALKASQAKFAATGADFVTNGPQLMVVGENSGGRERVQVTPLSSPNLNGPSNTSNNVSFGNININLNSGAEFMDYLQRNPDEFGKLFKNALKRGAIKGAFA